MFTRTTGIGNGDGTEGAHQGRVVGTYLHGPVLARNPALADLLLEWAVGNSDYSSVSLMLGGAEHPTERQLDGTVELREHLAALGAGAEVRGQLEFFAPECPGHILYDPLRRGRFGGTPRQAEEIE
ncbi:hypothetical protein KALB_2027 [Kutzneria albida DSM 43870]|uniref:CobB/CobQ-like glutamine amidotransferase domain-containing protein n=1 Tax=Kutzneria albida DSM 43870 TaxID=1449976 RepID=W5W4J2_9PSEU|nr:hypothetical protein KALB_2027 [Kutzneria albida DSM 43870]